MKSLKDRITPSIVISSLALFVALGGASYAALGANSVGSKQLKKNAVVTAKIKNNAVTTAKVKNDAITGAKVKESSLGAVPLATQANNATTADSSSTAGTATTAQSAQNFDGYKSIGVRKLQSTASNPSFTAAQAAATEVPLLELGTITIYAKCFTSGSTLYAAHYIKTSQNGAIFDSYYDYAFGIPNYLDTGTPEADREIYYQGSGPNSVAYPSSLDPTYVTTANGESWLINTWVVSKQGTLPGGDGAYGPGAVCLYQGNAQEM